MKHFIVGPVETYPSTKNIYQKDFPYFRTTQYGDMVKNTLKRLNSLLGNSVENSIIYFASSGTGVMEATVDNCVNNGDKCLVINGGTFGRRFCELLEYHNKSFDSVDLKWNEALTIEHLKPFDGKGYTTLFVNLHETSTGQLYDIKILREFCKKNNMYLIVDAISTFLADEYDMGGIDVTIISSQKGLCLSPGMSFISLSQRMLNKIETIKPVSKYFSFKDYLVNITRGQTPYTPPVFIMYELEDMLNLIDKEGGKKARLKFVEEKCKYFRKRAKDLGFVIPDYPLSNMLTPLYFEDVNAYDVIQILKDEYGLYVNPCGGELATKLLRVSHIGNTTLEDIDNLLEKLELAIEKVKMATM